ncbi:MAG: hypothetical protein K2K93_03555 [Muribaculaceae bacterium]|nr:hypothetical protein [Muribaculaceae bacterium]
MKKKFLVLLCAIVSYTCGFCQSVEADSCYMDMESQFDCATAMLNEDLTLDQDEAKSDITSTNVNHNFKDNKYWGRYTALRAAGWACFGAGAGFLIGGYALLFAAMTTTNDSWANAAGIMGGIMFFSSPVLVTASIPLLACAYYNRYKAKHLKLDVGVSCIHSERYAPCKVSAPALSLALNF